MARAVSIVAAILSASGCALVDHHTGYDFSKDRLGAPTLAEVAEMRLRCMSMSGVSFDGHCVRMR